MKKIISAFGLFILFSTPLHAEELYAVERADGGVSIVNYFGGKSLEEVLKSSGLEGRPIKPITRADLPSRADRNYWKMNDVPIGKKIIVDTVKRQEAEAAKAQKEARKQALLKMTPQEYQEAKDLGLVR